VNVATQLYQFIYRINIDQVKSVQSAGELLDQINNVPIRKRLDIFENVISPLHTGVKANSSPVIACDLFYDVTTMQLNVRMNEK
jgi:hypothetical protein